MKTYPLVVFGEALIDFTPYGNSEMNNPIFERNPGGSTANLSCAAATHGAKTTFISQVGDDMFGQALKEIIGGTGVDTQYMKLSKDYKTSLAFVQLDENGERKFSFYRKKAADTMISSSDLPLEVLKDCAYLATGSVVMAEGSSREATFEAMKVVRENGGIIFFDPNLRFNLWESVKELKDVNLEAFQYVDILKVSDEELPFLMDEEDLELGIAKLFERYPMTYILLTLGKKGTILYHRDFKLEDKGFPVERTVDTTGAGDSFSGSFLSQIILSGVKFADLSKESLRKAIRYGNATASLVTQKRGGISSLPSIKEVLALIDGQ